MKVLKIENKKCYYSIDGINYTKITDITKDDIYNILSIIYSTNDYTLDLVEEQTEIENDVEKLIYTNICNQIQTFIENIENLKNEIDSELSELLQKYQLEENEKPIESILGILSEDTINENNLHNEEKVAVGVGE